MVVYALGLLLPGTGPFLQDKMPYEVVVIGLITGTVTSLLAIGLILLYRSNRFINFAYGSMGSMVFAWLTAYAYGAGRLSRALRRRRSARAVNGTVGTVFVALGGRLALATH